ncbi:MAG: peptide deformylase [Patescibacteria group bacterium]|jgi:peptide deformylase
MEVLPLTLQPNKILRAKSHNLPIAELPNYVELGQQMIVVMIKNTGIGLAAPQVAKNINLFVINKDVAGTPDHLVLANPKIVFSSKTMNVMEEGCLSCPTLFGDVRRPEKVRVKAYTLDGKKHLFKAKGLLAKVFQHEIDHLTGVLIIDKFEA